MIPWLMVFLPPVALLSFVIQLFLFFFFCGPTRRRSATCTTCS